MGDAPRRLEDPQGRWMKLAAKAGHTVPYLLLIGLPLTGWYAPSRVGVPVSFFGISVPSIAAPVAGPPGLIGELHQNAGTLILILACMG